MQPLKNPLKPVHVSPDHRLADDLSQDTFNVICLSASKLPPHDRDYVQGAADDQEGWACGLTPQMFWANEEELLSCRREELPHKLQAVVNAKNEGDEEIEMYGVDGIPFSLCAKPTGWLSRTDNADFKVSKVFKKSQEWPIFLSALEARLGREKEISFDNTLGKEEGRDWVVACLLISLCKYTRFFVMNSI